MKSYFYNRMKSEDRGWIVRVLNQTNVTVRFHGEIQACGHVTQADLLLPPDGISCH